MLVVYGIPIVACFVLIGPGPLAGATGEMRRATVRGLAWFGSLSVLALIISFAIAIAYEAVDPSLLGPLSNSNPVLSNAAGNPWFWVGFSFLAGAAEELIFRGFFFGYWLQRGVTRWVVPALATTALFAGLHLYYGFTYLAASPIAFVTLFLVGLSFAATFRDTGGNLVVIALLHGAFDATIFLTLVAPALGLALHYGLIVVGALVAFALYTARRETQSVYPPAPVPAGAPGGTPTGPIAVEPSVERPSAPDVTQP